MHRSWHEILGACIAHGAAVVLACRNVAKGEALKSEIEAEDESKGFPKPTVEVRQLDLASVV